MKINEKWSIESGGECYVVVETRKGTNPKTGEPSATSVRTYHPTLEKCAKKIGDSETLSVLEIEQVEAAVTEFALNTNRLVAAIHRVHFQEQTA